jgi:hypothetical protein
MRLSPRTRRTMSVPSYSIGGKTVPRIPHGLGA